MKLDKVLKISAALIILSIVIEITLVHPHVEYWFHSFTAFDAIYGFIGCILIVVVSKALGKRYLQKREDYWDRGEPDD